MIKETARGNGNLLAAYPEDFKIYSLGEFNTSTGQIGLESKPRLILPVKELLSKGVGNNVEN